MDKRQLIVNGLITYFQESALFKETKVGKAVSLVKDVANIGLFVPNKSLRVAWWLAKNLTPKVVHTVIGATVGKVVTKVKDVIKEPADTIVTNAAKLVIKSENAAKELFSQVVFAGFVGSIVIGGVFAQRALPRKN